MFIDRIDAGKKLSLELNKFKDENPVVLAIPRGGIVTAYETIKKFGFQWDLIIPRKIGAPQNKEVAIGAVSLDGSYLLNDEFYAVGLHYQIFQQTTDEEVINIIKKIKMTNDISCHWSLL